MTTKKVSLTSGSKFVNIEFIRRGASGLELVTRTGQRETVTPVRVTSKIERNRIVVGYEPRFINGELKVF
jgi:hypothetical protein